MRAVIQRVNYALVKVDGETVGEIGKGYLVLLGAGKGDTEEDCSYLADRIMGMRIFSDENGKINLSIKDVDGELLIVSQFTLYGDYKKRRPGFLDAAPPNEALALYEHFCKLCEGQVKKVAKGVFGADMKVNLENDGPFTVCLDSKAR